jgi:hypothetical protein
MRRRIVAAVLLLTALAARAQPAEPVEGFATIGAPLCPRARELVLDDSRRFEVPLGAGATGAVVQVRNGRVVATTCGRAPGLVAERLEPAGRPPRVRVAFVPEEASRRLHEIDALALRYPDARFDLRVLGAGGDEAALRIAQALLAARPDLLARTTLAGGDGPAGWRVTLSTGERDAASMDDVARLLAGAR